MKRYVGRTLAQGIAWGKILFYRKEEKKFAMEYAADPEQEWTRYQESLRMAEVQIQGINPEGKKRPETLQERVFQAQITLMRDQGIQNYIKEQICTGKKSAEYAVASAGEHYCRIVAELKDPDMKERWIDVKDITDRILSILTGNHQEIDTGTETVILAASSLTPSDTVQMERHGILGFVTEQGSCGSHTAILARTLQIPALTGISVSEDMNGKLAVLDGFRGQLILEPDKETLAFYQEKLEAYRKEKAVLKRFRHEEDKTLDGKEIRLYANIASVKEVASVLENDAQGIGLFRSEFLYLGKTDYPSEEEQFQAYRTVVKAMGGKPVIIRTLDIGADKQAEYFHLEREENPAMGYRGIRICLDRIALFKTQLRAVLRASAFGKVSLMYPMIISREEVLRAKSVVEEVKKELLREGIPVGEVEQGIMIETPAAVLISDLLAKEVDFFSIGTNDLTQYLLAADRQNERLEAIYDPCHPAVLRAIRMVIDHGHQEGCWVGICGELGADTRMTEQLLKMGMDEFSVIPEAVLPIRKIIRKTDLRQNH